MMEVLSDMSGSVAALRVAVGDAVAEDDDLLILESMKMEIPVGAPADGTVAAVHVAVGDRVDEGDLLVTLS